MSEARGQVISPFNNLLRGKVGCPTCVDEIRANFLNSERAKVHKTLETFQQLVNALRQQSEVLDDESFGRPVRSKLSELDL